MRYSTSTSKDGSEGGEEGELDIGKDDVRSNKHLPESRPPVAHTYLASCFPHLPATTKRTRTTSPHPGQRPRHAAPPRATGHMACSVGRARVATQRCSAAVAPLATCSAPDASKQKNHVAAPHAGPASSHRRWSCLDGPIPPRPAALWLPVSHLFESHHARSTVNQRASTAG